jgi:hypothetical protein
MASPTSCPRRGEERGRRSGRICLALAHQQSRATQRPHSKRR